MKYKSILGLTVALAMFIQSAYLFIDSIKDTTDSLVVSAAESQSTYEYRYHTKTTTESKIELSTPWIFSSSRDEYSSYDNWSDWQRSSIPSSDTREVASEERKTIASYEMVSYRTRGNPNTVDYGCYVVNTGALNVRSGPGTEYDSFGSSESGSPFKVDQISGSWGHTISIHTNNGVKDGWVNLNYCKQSGDRYVQYRNYSVNGNFSRYDLNSSWGEHTEGSPWTWDPGTLNSARQVAPWTFTTGLVVNDGSFNADGYNMTDQTGYVVNDGYAAYIWFINKINYNSETWYRYRERTKTTIYTYYKWSDWSEWSTEQPVASAEIEIEKREVVPATTTDETTTTTKNNIIQLNKDNYSFLNTAEYFNSTYQMSDSFLSLLGENLSNIEWDSISAKSGGVKWDGSCYGMSVVQILAKDGLLKANTIDKNSNWIYDWNAPIKDANVESIINYYHMLQYSDVFKYFANQFTKCTNKKQVDNLIQMATKAENGGNPALVCFLFTKQPSDRLGAGHAVVAYGIEYGTWTYRNKYNCRILISDPNVNGFADDCCIYIDTNTYKWEIPYYQSKYYNCANDNQNKNDNPYARFRLVSNDLNLLDTFGYLRKGQTVNIKDADSTVDINSDSNGFNVAYYDEKQTSSISDAECELVFYSGLLDSNSTSRIISAILPKADTPYEFFEKDYTSFDTSMKYTNSMLRAKATSGLNAIYKPDESVEIRGKNSDYDLYMVTNEGNCSTDWYKIHVNGVNSNNGTLNIVNNGYIVSSDGLADGLFIDTSNRKNTAKLGIVTEYDSVLVYEIDENTIGVKVDKNNDGIYETKFTPDYLGDINEDGNVTIADAVKLQRYLLNVDSIDRKQYIYGDINMDGSVDIFDMVLIKRTLLNK